MNNAAPAAGAPPQVRVERADVPPLQAEDQAFADVQDELRRRMGQVYNRAGVVNFSRPLAKRALRALISNSILSEVEAGRGYSAGWSLPNKNLACAILIDVRARSEDNRALVMEVINMPTILHHADWAWLHRVRDPAGYAAQQAAAAAAIALPAAVAPPAAAAAAAAAAVEVKVYPPHITYTAIRKELRQYMHYIGFKVSRHDEDAVDLHDLFIIGAKFDATEKTRHILLLFGVQDDVTKGIYREFFLMCRKLYPDIESIETSPGIMSQIQTIVTILNDSPTYEGYKTNLHRKFTGFNFVDAKVQIEH